MTRYLTIVERRASEIRRLLESGAFTGVPFFTRDGRLLPADLLARIVLEDLNRLKKQERNPGRCNIPAWQRLVEDVELLHEVASPQDGECMTA